MLFRSVPDSGRAARQISLGIYKVPRRAVRAPTLVVGSEDDRFIPLGVARRVARMYGAAFHVARAHGHFLFSEPGWEAEAAHILDWVDALPRVIREPASSGHPFPDGENGVPDARVSTPANHRPAPESP